jgi:hypothetical protein
MYLQMHYQNLCSGKFLLAYFFTINNLSLQQSILYDIIVYMALNKNIQCIPCINKNNPSQGKTFYKMESLELSTRFVTDSEHKQSINQTLSLASRDYFYAKNYLSYSPIKNRTLQIINPFYLSTLTTLHDIPQNPYLTNILF